MTKWNSALVGRRKRGLRCVVVVVVLVVVEPLTELGGACFDEEPAKSASRRPQTPSLEKLPFKSKS